MLKLIDVSIKAARHNILNPFSVSISHGENILVIGPSGAGKSTLLNFIAGFIPTKNENRFLANRWFAGADTGLVSAGRLMLNGRDISFDLPEAREFGLVNQKHSVYPHLSVLDNIAFPLKCKGMRMDKRISRAKELALIVRLNEKLFSRKVVSLSGGEQQRVAIAKLLARKAYVGLLDEPFSHLDPILKKDLVEFLMNNIRAGADNDFPESILMVSHDWHDIQYASNIILIVKSDSAEENVIVLSRNGSSFVEESDNLSPIQKKWVTEINSSLRR